ncbi:MAG TPA: L-threonylcarbamoyladenylate synthase [Paenalcaligenes sp.]|nr:L-threonylcarbamoyladenylate synthase [Paenalcaligenes sp.]
MTQLFVVHPENPQPRLISQAAQMIAEGKVVATPTDSSYALVTRLDDRAAAEALRRLRGLDERHNLTLLCRDLAEISHFAKVDNVQYRLLKLATPGPWTFILEATKQVPRRVSHPAKKTIGIRVPQNPILQSLIEHAETNLLSTTLIPEGEEDPLNDAQRIAERYKGRVAAVIDGGPCPLEPTTVIDLTTDVPAVQRLGQGDPQKIGLE